MDWISVSDRLELREKILDVGAVVEYSLRLLLLMLLLTLHLLSMSDDREHSDEVVGWLVRRTDERVVLDDDAVSIRRSAMVVMCV